MRKLPQQADSDRRDFQELLRSALSSCSGDVSVLARTLGKKPYTVKRWLLGKQAPKPNTMYKCRTLLMSQDTSVRTGLTVADVERIVTDWQGVAYHADHQSLTLTAANLVAQALKSTLPKVFDPYTISMMDSEVPSVEVVMACSRVVVRLLVTLHLGGQSIIKVILKSPHLPRDTVHRFAYSEKTAWGLCSIITPILETHDGQTSSPHRR